MNIIDYSNIPMGTCSVCQKREELRPYGKDGALVCFDCAMKDEEEAKRQFAKQFDKPGPNILIL